jgi:nucleotide-binding universal stress UspA family protein
VSPTVFLSLLGTTFVCIGLVLAIVMGRLGYSSFTWGLLGLVLGPIALLLALSSARNGRPSWSRLLAGGDPGSGPVDVLIGIDGSRESAAAASAALDLLGDRVGRLALVAVTAIDESPAGREEQARLQAELERQAQELQLAQRGRRQSGHAGQTVIPALMLRSGQPAAVLDEMAVEDGYSLVVGARGAGLSTVLLAVSPAGWPLMRACRFWWSGTGLGGARATARLASSTMPARDTPAARASSIRLYRRASAWSPIAVSTSSSRICQASVAATR